AVHCWGMNDSGQLDDGTITDRITPVAVLGGFTFATVSASAGGGHTCGITTGGATYCWGHNAFGELGDGTTIDQASPVAVAGGASFAAVSAGGGHTCGVTAAGVAYCWGYNNKGQVGDGTTTDRTSPVAVLGGISFAVVSAGAGQTCGVTTTGGAYCWGWNSEGQLGDANRIDSATPVAVWGGLSFAAVSSAGGGGYVTCGVATLNGSVETSLDSIGVAAVSGLTDGAAAELATAPDVRAVEADRVTGISGEQVEAADTAADLAPSPSLASLEGSPSPTSAPFYPRQ